MTEYVHIPMAGPSPQAPPTARGDLADRANNLRNMHRANLNRLRGPLCVVAKLHAPREAEWGDSEPYCDECGELWPCRTYAAACSEVAEL